MDPTVNGNTSPFPSVNAATCLIAVWLNFPPVQQMLDQLTSTPLPSAALSTPYALQALLWAMRGSVQLPEMKTLDTRWTYPQSLDPAETHDTLIDSCLKSPGADSSTKTLADHQTIWYNIAEIFPSQRTVLLLGRIDEVTKPVLFAISQQLIALNRDIIPTRTPRLQISELGPRGYDEITRPVLSDDSYGLQQLIDKNRHIMPPGTPKLQILELGRRGYDGKKRAWLKDCRKVTIPDKVTIDSTPYVLYALITHSGDFRSQKYYPYVRPGGIGQQWYYYRKNAVLPVDHQRATILNQGNGGIKYQIGTVEMNTNEVAYILYYAREDVMTGESDGSVGQQPDHDEDEDDESDDDERDEDGDEVIEDRADDEHGPLHTQVTTSPSRPLESAVSFPGTTNLDPAVSIPETSTHVDGIPKQTTRDFIGSDYFRGTTVNDVPHGTGTLIAIATGDQYNGSFERGMKSGYGKTIFANGDVYEGTWASDQQNGQGTFTEALTGNVYTGGWKDGRPHGKGTTVWQMAQDQKAGCRICLAADAQIVFIRCGHVCACEVCAAALNRCPACRELIRGKQKIYEI